MIIEVGFSDFDEGGDACGESTAKRDRGARGIRRGDTSRLTGGARACHKDLGVREGWSALLRLGWGDRLSEISDGEQWHLRR